MMAITIGSVIASLGLGLLSNVLAGKGKPLTAMSFEDQPTTLATRGAYIPVVFGRRRVAPIFTWAGDRLAVAVRRGKKGGGRTATGFEYHEAGMHALSIGPIDIVHAILVDSTKIYDGPLLSSAGSGVAITLVDPHSGSAFVYFGERCQPINTSLGQGSGSGTLGIGVSSRWPRIAYVEHRRLFLGSAPIWPEVQYDIEAHHPAPLTAAPDWITETTSGAADGGVNPAHALWSALFDPYPRGAGLDPLLASCDCFNALAALFATERIPINFTAHNGLAAIKFIAFLLQEMQILLPSVAGMIAPRALRETVAGQISLLASITPDSYGPGLPQFDDRHAPFDLTRVAYAFDDHLNNFRSQTVRRDADGAVDGAGRIREKIIRIETSTDSVTAAKSPFQNEQPGVVMCR